MSGHKRTDVLTDGLLHYGHHLYFKFGVSLKAKYLRAETLLKDVTSKLKAVTDKLPVECDTVKIQEWKDEEVDALKPKEQGLILQWDETYVSLLLSAKKLRNELTCVQEEDQEKVRDVEKKIKRNEKAIKATEKKHNVRERWSDVSHVFITVKSRLNEKRKSELLLKLHCMASERCFLVELKLKYADGQAIATKLSKQIDKVVKSINKTLSEVNGLLPVDKQILYVEAKDPKSSLYSTMTDGGTTVPATLRRQIIDLSCLSKRCEEETNMLKEEMRRLVSFIHEQIRLIDEYVDTLQPDVPLNAGLTACLK
ncbi:uncharacterized protein LOC116308321 [Actinia tenebrosa]|uniref:Uncharacterized protein LOC116308321 n=1 Tax=Actinia tenebrosa TaxID=6105 RepID=A0A6P8J4G3_ACTTE|nr:uncharacterized protein LOC116308321 [Actinia tenebrosa]